MYFDSSRHAEIIKYLEYPDFAELIFAAAVVREPEANVIPVVFRVMPTDELCRSEACPGPGSAANRFDQWPGDMFNRPTPGPAATQMSADHGPWQVIGPLLAFGLNPMLVKSNSGARNARLLRHFFG